MFNDTSFLDPAARWWWDRWLRPPPWGHCIFHRAAARRKVGLENRAKRQLRLRSVVIISMPTGATTTYANSTSTRKSAAALTGRLSKHMKALQRRTNTLQLPRTHLGTTNDGDGDDETGHNVDIQQSWCANVNKPIMRCNAKGPSFPSRPLLPH